MSDTMVEPIAVLVSETSDCKSFQIIQAESEEAAARRLLKNRLTFANNGKAFTVWTVTEAEQIPKRRELRVVFLGSIGLACWES